MNTKDAAVLKAACESLRDRYVTPQGSVLYRLETVEKNLLAQKILLLPEQDRLMVFCRYCFGLTPSATGKLLDLAHPKERMGCCIELLTDAMELYRTAIADNDMEAAARHAMSRYMLEYGIAADAPPHSYSDKLRKQLGEISTIPRRGGVVILFVKRALIAALIATMMFSTALAASPALRKLVFDWVVYTFPKYSQIGAANVDREPTEEDFAILKQYYPTYVPEGYTLHEVVEMFPATIYDYRNDSEDMLFLYGSLQDESLTYYNSEGATIETLTYLGQPAFYWEQDGSTFFIWQQDGFQFSIVGEITKEDAIKMTESTKLQN